MTQKSAAKGSQGIGVSVGEIVGLRVAVERGGREVDVDLREGRIVDVVLIPGATVGVEAQEARNIKQKKLGINLIKTPKG